VFRYLEYIREASEALWRNRARSILTMLGMIIGTASVIAVFGISRAAASGIGSMIDSFGAPGNYIAVDSTQPFPQRATIEYRDLASIEAQTSGLIASLQPNYSGAFRVRVGTRSGFESVNEQGGYAPADQVALQEGRRIDMDDVDSAAHVVVLTADLAEKYFPAGSAVGSFMTVNGSRFQVIGVYSPISGSLFSSIAGSGVLFIPYSTLHNMIPGPISGGIFFYSEPGVKDDDAIAAVKRALEHIHGPQAQYSSQNGADAIGSFSKVINIIAAGLSGIGAVALLVAGIGIMNIMLVSVVERTREIGIRKSIGASRRDIALQFLMEATILSLLGGGTGLALGLVTTIGVASYISKQLGAAIIPYLMLVALALVFSIGIGMAFGMYPAIRAAKLDPIEALRS
jgi:putative ABC transport system permease protein